MMHVSSSLRRRLTLTGACSVLIAMMGSAAYAQVEITDARTTGVETATAGTDSAASDVTTTSDSSFIITGAGPALTLNSDNALVSGGAISITDVDDATGIAVDTSAGALTGSLNVTGAITLDETFAPEDTDDDRIVDGKFAEGSGRTGILISGADTFTGPVTVTGAIGVEGNDSAGIRVMEAAGLIGDVTIASSITGIGDNFRGIDLRSPVTGNLSIASVVQTTGEGATAVDVSGDVSDRLTVSGAIINTGNRILSGGNVPTRLRPADRDLLDDEDTLEASNAVSVSGNIAGGVYLSDVRDSTGLFVRNSTINQFGTQAAVLISGDGTPIIIGRVSDITDPDDENYNANLQFSLVNEASISGTNVLDDRDATGVRIANADLTDGFNNTGSIASQTFRSPNTGDADTNVGGEVAVATGIDIGAGADISVLRNTGSITATSTEATGLAFADQDNPLDPNPQLARGINIDAGATVPELTNLGRFDARINGRQGTAYALVDSSGTLAVLNNQGEIVASGQNTDTSGTTAADFTLVALDASQNTTGFTLTQSFQTDSDPDDGISVITPEIAGDILLGSGPNVIDIQAGAVVSNITFGTGANTLMIAEGAGVGGTYNTPGALTIDAAGPLAAITAASINADTATFRETGVFRPFIDGSTDGAASTLVTTGAVTFEDGATISPILQNVIGGDGTFTIVEAGTLSFTGDAASLRSGDVAFLYNAEISEGTAPNSLDVTLTRKEIGELGLDTVQQAAFEQTFSAISADAELGSAFVGLITESDFNSAYNQLLPEFNAAAARFIHSNTDGATGAVSTHLKNARVSDERPGGAWIEEFAFYTNRELQGLSEAYEGYGFGFTGGFDTEFGPFHTAGVNFGFAATEVEDVLGFDSPLAVQTLQAGVYAGWESGNLGVDIYAGGGLSGIESARSVRIGDYRASTEAEWDGTHVNAAITAGYDFAFSDRYFMRPELSVSYMSLTEDSYEETGADAIRFLIDERTSDIGSATALVNFGAKFGDDRVWWSSALRLGAINEFEGSGIVTGATYFDSASSTFDPLNKIILAGQEFPDTGAILGFSIAAGSKYSSFGFDYDADIRDGYNRHIARLVLRLLF